jgi:hypothetical protein
MTHTTAILNYAHTSRLCRVTAPPPAGVSRQKAHPTRQSGRQHPQSKRAHQSKRPLLASSRGHPPTAKQAHKYAPPRWRVHTHQIDPIPSLAAAARGDQLSAARALSETAVVEAVAAPNHRRPCPPRPCPATTFPPSRADSRAAASQLRTRARSPRQRHHGGVNTPAQKANEERARAPRRRSSSIDARSCACRACISSCACAAAYT